MSFLRALSQNIQLGIFYGFTFICQKIKWLLGKI